MRPPGSVSYPVQASGQLHDAKLVPVCNDHSPIEEQLPSASAHTQDRYSLQSMSVAEYQPQQPGPLIVHFVFSLSCRRGENCHSSCCGAQLHFPCAASSFMHESVEPNSLHSWGGTEAGLSPGTSAYRRAASEAKSAHPAEM